MTRAIVGTVYKAGAPTEQLLISEVCIQRCRRGQTQEDGVYPLMLESAKRLPSGLSKVDAGRLSRR